MIDVNSDDTDMLSPKGIACVRTGIPMGLQSDDMIRRPRDSGIKGDSELRRSVLPGFGDAQGRTQK